MITPNSIEQALTILGDMERMVQAIQQVAGLSAQHQEWLDRVHRLSRDVESRAELAVALVDGPLEEPMDRAATVDEDRHRVLACALLEAGLFEQQSGGKLSGGAYDPRKLRQSLLEWLKQGAWRALADSPLTEIGRMVERSAQTSEEALATRLGLLVPFWSSLTLWVLAVDAESLGAA